MIRVTALTEETKGTILFVHGMCQGAWCWDQGFMQEFAKAGYNCYAIDLPLHNKPGKNKAVNNQSIDDYVAFVKKTTDDLGKDVIVVGHSMGGFIAQKFLERYFCRAVVLLASVPHSGILPGSLRFLMKHPDAFPNLITRDIFGPFVKYAEDLYASTTDRQKIEHYKSLMRSESFQAVLDMMFKPVKVPNPNKVPMLIAGADDDLVITQKEVKMTAEYYLETPVFFSGLGHNLMLDKDYQVVSGSIIKWLNLAFSM